MVIDFEFELYDIFSDRSNERFEDLHVRSSKVLGFLPSIANELVVGTGTLYRSI